MSVRHVVYNVLTATAPVTAVYGTRIIDEGQLGDREGQQPEFPFLVTKYGEATRGASRTTKVQVLELWSYDHPSDYTRTDAGLDAIYAALHQRGGDAAVVAGEPTTWLVEALWESTSRSLTDDVLRASVRYATYKVVTNTP
jgi:hypothetical protein